MNKVASIVGTVSNSNPVDLYVLEIYNTRFSGYNTFQREFLAGMEQYEWLNIYVVVEETPISRIKKERKERVTYIYFPCIKQNQFAILESYMKAAINAAPRMVFLSNFFPAIFNIKAIKNLFPHAKIIHITHDLPWLSVFAGDEMNYIKYIHDELPGILSPQCDKFVRYCTYDIITSFQLVDIVVSLCQSTYHMLTDFYEIPTSQVRLIFNGMQDYAVEREESERLSIRHKYNFPESGVLILIVGRLTRSKGADRIHDLFRVNNAKEKYLVYIGEDDVFKWIPPEIATCTYSLGFKSQSELHDLYSIADLGLFPSRHEQCSYTGIEFLMHGIPVIATSAYGVRDMFNSKNAIIVPPVSLQITLSELESKKRLARMEYLNKYTNENMISLYISLITELVS